MPVRAPIPRLISWLGLVLISACSGQTNFTARTMGTVSSPAPAAEANAVTVNESTPTPVAVDPPTPTPTPNPVQPPPPVVPPPSGWVDVTTNSSGAPSSCAVDPARCTFRHPSIPKDVSKAFGGMPWNQARNHCLSLNHNGSAGWILPDSDILTSISRFSETLVSSAAGWSGQTFWSATFHPDGNNLPYYVSHTGGTAFSYLDTYINPGSNITRQDIINSWNLNYNNVLCVK